MKEIYIDCEFNGFEGELISMALVANGGREFYEVVQWDAPTEPWVKENVVPHLGKEPIPWKEFQRKLEAFLVNECAHGNFDIVADWPDDIKYFCQAIIVAPGVMMPIGGFGCTVVRGVDYVSLVPHNALEDARAIRKFCHGE